MVCQALLQRYYKMPMPCSCIQVKIRRSVIEHDCSYREKVLWQHPCGSIRTRSQHKLLPWSFLPWTPQHGRHLGECTKGAEADHSQADGTRNLSISCLSRVTGSSGSARENSRERLSGESTEARAETHSFNKRRRGRQLKTLKEERDPT